MKNEVWFGIIGSLCVTAFTFFLVQIYHIQTQDTILTNITKLTNESTELTTSEISKHASQSDCWLLIDGKVYDVSNFILKHPGGANRILPYCGKDATQAFATRGGEGTHSVIAKSELEKLYIGDLEGKKLLNVNVANTNQVPENNNTPLPTKQSNVTLDLVTIGSHNVASDCWIIVSNTVYAVTSYLTAHPGGANRIIPYCGRDATQAFRTQGGTGQHSSSASAILTRYAIGVVGSSTSSQNINSVIQSAPPPTTQGGENEQEEEDDD